MNLIIKIKTHLPQPTTIETHESPQPPILHNSRTNIIYNQTPKKKIQSKKPKRADWGGRKGGQKGRQWKLDRYGRKREKEGWRGRKGENEVGRGLRSLP